MFTLFLNISFIILTKKTVSKVHCFLDLNKKNAKKAQKLFLFYVVTKKRLCYTCSKIKARRILYEQGEKRHIQDNYEYYKIFNCYNYYFSNF